MFSNLMLTADSSSYTYLFGQLGVVIRNDRCTLVLPDPSPEQAGKGSFQDA